MGFKKTICSMLIISLVFSAGITTLAYTDNSLSNYNKAISEKSKSDEQHPPCKKNKKNCVYRKMFNSSIDELVKEGKLSKEKADNIIELANKKHKNKRNKNKGKRVKHISFVEELISLNIINNKEAEEIRKKISNKIEEYQTERFNTLIEKKVITQEEAVKIKDYLDNARKERHEQIKKIKNMSESEKENFFKLNKNKYKSIFDKMVVDGVITKKQVKEIKNIFSKQS